MSGRESSWQPMVSVENFHRFARAPPATRRHAQYAQMAPLLEHYGIQLWAPG